MVSDFEKAKIEKEKLVENQQVILRNARKVVEQHKRDILEALASTNLNDKFDCEVLVTRLNALNNALNDLDIDQKRSRQGFTL